MFHKFSPSFPTLSLTHSIFTMLRSLKKIGSMRSRNRSSSSETYTTPQQLTHTAPANITLVGGVELGGEGLEPEEKSLDQLKIDALTLEVQALGCAA